AGEIDLRLRELARLLHELREELADARGRERPFPARGPPRLFSFHGRLRMPCVSRRRTADARPPCARLAVQESSRECDATTRLAQRVALRRFCGCAAV